jgi:hypothetical protein
MKPHRIARAAAMTKRKMGPIAEDFGGLRKGGGNSIEFVGNERGK